METSTKNTTQHTNTGKYYVYVHRKKDDGTVFYVGKGTRDRMKQTRSRNKYWHNIVNKHGFYYEFVEQFVTDEIAKELEMFLITEIGRQNLCNLTDGGDGSYGYIPTEETRKKLSKASKNRVWTKESRLKLSKAKKGICPSKETIAKIVLSRKGFKHSIATKQKMSEMRKGVPHSEAHRKALSENSGRARAVKCIELDKTFKSCSEAAKYLGDICKRKGINDVALGRQKTAYSYHWEFINKRLIGIGNV